MTLEELKYNALKKKYFKKRDGTLYMEKTKEELMSEVNPDIPETFISILEKLNYPYLKYEWKISTIQAVYKKNILKIYINKMQLLGYKHLTFEDSDLINSIMHEKGFI